MADNRCVRIYDLKQKIQYHPDIGTYVLEEDIDLMERVFVEGGKVEIIATDSIENKLKDMYGVDTIEFEDPKDFTQHYCHNCGSQRCEGVGTPWFEGCQQKEHLKDYEKFYG